jgi:hypothetical protein
MNSHIVVVVPVPPRDILRVDALSTTWRHFPHYMTMFMHHIVGAVNLIDTLRDGARDHTTSSSSTKPSTSSTPPHDPPPHSPPHKSVVASTDNPSTYNPPPPPPPPPSISPPMCPNLYPRPILLLPLFLCLCHHSLSIVFLLVHNCHHPSTPLFFLFLHMCHKLLMLWTLWSHRVLLMHIFMIFI